ncbi:Peroxidase [Mycena sanguinolenta]|uniref:Peroxidase n=1 Tax=Mycena sanguinolenta TaxID=230812 RepID=A0A8H6X6C1_9AGAR|nr:Peroxidase [Mycena sanguinolenta]
MSTLPHRQRVIDDTDPTIQYGSNDWFIADPSIFTNAGNFGPLYRNSSHATTSSANLTFSFNGTDLHVFGTINVSINSTTNTTDPTWQCFVDDIKIGNTNPTFQYPENNQLLCWQPELVESSEHVLTIHVQTKGQPFYFDYLLYTTLPDASFDTAVLLYPYTDPSVSFGPGWEIIGSAEKGTNDYGSQVSLSFHGTSVIPYGFVPNQLPPNATWATYAIDDGESVNFTLNGLSSPQSSTEYFVPLFTTPTLPSAPHNLVLTYGGDNQHTPLVIQGFYVTNTTTVFSEPSSPSSSTSSPSASLSPNPTQPTSAGAIVGGVIGGIILVTVLGFFYSKRRRQRHPDLTSANPYPMSMAQNLEHAIRKYSSFPVPAIASQPHLHSLPNHRAAAASNSGPSRNYTHIEHVAPIQLKLLTTPHRNSNSAGDIVIEGNPSAVVGIHEDSGVRFPPECALDSRLVELPPGYSPD